MYEALAALLSSPIRLFSPGIQFVNDPFCNIEHCT